MKISELINYLELIAPPALQESYDNAGLIVGKPDRKITGVLVCLDSTEEVIQEAMQLGCNLVVAHHPIVFRGLKRFNGKNYIERAVMKAIKHKISIYAIHTNLDNVYHYGVNSMIAEKIGLSNTQVLVPKQTNKKLITFADMDNSDAIRAALFEAGAGEINGSQQLSYSTVGASTQDGKGFGQVKLEVTFPSYLERKMIATLHHVHPSNQPVYDIITLDNKNTMVGSGMIGTLKKPMAALDFLKHLKQSMQVNCIKYTKTLGKKISKVALCGGSGGFLLKDAIAQKADIFITADYKYHEFFDANDQIIIADIGHYESEQFTIQLLDEIIKKKFRNFATHCTKVNTNPVNYL